MFFNGGLYMIKKEEFYFDSRDEVSKIHALKWIPEGAPRAIFQIIHGMQEYADRYDEFARYLAERGILVIASDHLGHGLSSKREDYGYFCSTDPRTVVVRDVHRLKKTVQEQYPGIPIILLGHSMGSFVLRNYLSRYGTGIQAAIIMGTGSQPAMMLHTGLFMCSFLEHFKGERYISTFIEKSGMGSYCKRIVNPNSKMDWLSVREENVKNYIEDEMCGVPFTVNGYRTLFTLIKYCQSKKNMQELPKSLPILFTSGEEDPVGHYGRDVNHLFHTYQRMGFQHVDIKLYPELRHEILNEDIREQVYENVYNWTNQVILGITNKKEV